MTLSFYNNLTDINSNITISFDDFIDSIRIGGVHVDTVEKIRKLKADGKDYQRLKKTLPLVSVSGTFKSHTDADIIEHSGLICIDFDGFETIGDAELRRDELSNDQYVKASFLSASGNVAVIVEIDPTRHADSFTCLDAYFDREYQLTVDTSGRNVSRYRYLSYDPELVINCNACRFIVNDEYIESINVTDQLCQSAVIISNVNDIDRLIAILEQRQIDITADYNDWFRIGMALARNFKPAEGAEYFHRISKQNAGYSHAKTTKKFNGFVQTVDHEGAKPSENKENRKTSLKTLFYIAKNHGITVKPELSITQITDTAPVTNEGATWTIFDQIKKVLVTGHDIKLNTLTNRTEINGQQIDDMALNDLWQYVTAMSAGKVPDKDKLKAVINSKQWPTYHPVKQYFERLAPWDGIDRLAQLAEAMNSEKPAIAGLFLAKWLTGMVHCLYGTPNPLVLVLVGKVGTGKSRFYSDILPPELKSFFCESHLHPNDVVNNMNQNLIVYDDEMVGIKKMGIQSFKALTSSSVFSLTRKYEAFETKLDRIGTLGTTSNEFDVIEEDHQRRFLPIHINNDMNWSVMNKIDRTGLMAQLYHNYQTGFEWELAGADIAKLDAYADQFKKQTVEDELIHKYFERPETDSTRLIEPLTATEIMEYIMQKSSVKNLNRNNIGKALNRAGYFEKKSRRNGADVRRYWYVKTL